MGEVFSIICSDANGASKAFACTVDKGLDDVITFFVRAIPPPQSGEFFEAAYKVIDSATAEQIMINNHGAREYRRQGIPDALLPTVAKFLRKRIRSSPGRGVGQFRTPDAEKMWTRLVASGMACLDPYTDRYELPPRP